MRRELKDSWAGQPQGHNGLESHEERIESLHFHHPEGKEKKKNLMRRELKACVFRRERPRSPTPNLMRRELKAKRNIVVQGQARGESHEERIESRLHCGQTSPSVSESHEERIESCHT